MAEASELSPRLSAAAAQLERLRGALSEVIVGQREVVDQVLVALLAGGHVLLEGAPGLGKTLLVRTLAQCVDLDFSRIQFTPDLMPSDILGTQVLAQEPGGARSFRLHKGPVFCQILLADEINRASPKTQSALLEAMQEHAVTLAGERHALGPPFFVLATENPIEMEGTYPLPEAQLDRFLLKVLVPEPGEADLVDVLLRTTGRERPAPPRVLSRDEVLSLRGLCRDLVVGDAVARYAARLVKATNPADPSAPAIVRKSVRFGAGVRGAQSLLLGARAVALMKGNAHVSFADVTGLALPALRHRLLRSFAGEADGVSADALVRAVVDAVPARPEGVEAVLRERGR
ncbi:MAG: AAA family ATPase [Deltaproteobacteria bacterium]|nr:AAA family ATPase [Deltaproteobacteria bacterium]